MKKIKDPQNVTGESLQKAHDTGNLETKLLLENIYPDFFKKKETYKVGDRIKIELSDSNEEHIIATGQGGEIQLVSLVDGICFIPRTKVKDEDNITTLELEASLRHRTFKKIS